MIVDTAVAEAYYAKNSDFNYYWHPLHSVQMIANCTASQLPTKTLIYILTEYSALLLIP